MNLTRRAHLPELMDAVDLDIAEYNRCLTHLASVNRITFTHHTTLKFLQKATLKMPEGSKITILDLASGYGDLLREISRWADGRGFIATLTGVDLNPRSAAAAREATPSNMSIDYQTGDVFAFTPDVKPDFIVTSQFTHHLTDGAIVRLLRWMDATALKGWHVADLHRHPFPYYGFRFLCRLMRWHGIVRYDGTVSIARSFRREDWSRYLAEAELYATISWQPLFRYCVSHIAA